MTTGCSTRPFTVFNSLVYVVDKETESLGEALIMILMWVTSPSGSHTSFGLKNHDHQEWPLVSSHRPTLT